MPGSGPAIGEEEDEGEDEPEEARHLAVASEKQCLHPLACFSGAHGATDQEIAPVNGTASTEASLLQSYGKEYSQQLLGLDVLALSAGRSHEAKRWLFHYVSPLMHYKW